MKNVIKYLVIIVIAIISFGSESLCAGKYFWDMPTYTVDGITYAINVDKREEAENPIVRYVGAAVVQNPDKNARYEGTLKIPEKVTIEGIEYPVYAFVKLTEYKECISEDLIIELPNTIKVIGDIIDTPPVYKIKSINIPYSVEYISGMSYFTSGTRTIPGSVKLIGYQACFWAEELVVEDGVEHFGAYSVDCNNKTLTLPGTVKVGQYSIGDSLLECLIIKKSKNKEASPEFRTKCIDCSYIIKTIICEYENPPKANNDAFCLDKSESSDPLFPGYDEPYNPGMYDRATLYVPKAAVEAYKADAEWGRFEKILAIEDNADIIKKLEGVDDISADAAEVVATEYYDLSGRRLEAPAERGITITATIYSDGTRRCTKTVR